MITDKQVEAALIAFDPGFGAPIDAPHAKMWRAKMRAALEAAERVREADAMAFGEMIHDANKSAIPSGGGMKQ